MPRICFAHMTDMIISGITCLTDPLTHPLNIFALFPNLPSNLIHISLRSKKQTGQYLGVQSYLRIDPNAGSIELGHMCLSPAAQRTPVSTGAFFLMMQWAFENGYRRFEWKCDALNMPSRRAAQRLGLSYEGIFRQATVVKGRNRDTAWFAAIDVEWPALKEAFNAWLSHTNFDTNGQQKESLRNLTRLVLAQSDPMQDR